MTDRKARLAALAAKAGKAKQAPAVEDEETTIVTDAAAEVTAPTTSRPITFRNYTPAHGILNEENNKEEPSSKRSRQEEQPAVPASSALEQALEKAKAEAAITARHRTENLAVVAPKKMNWDLKRDIQPKLDKLERRTQKAIVQLLKERLQQEATAADNDVD
jgi:coiled-coil domain-containing protein 12